jgi:hypothetical protein
MFECLHTKGNRHLNGEFEVYRVVMGEIAFIQTSPQLEDTNITLAHEGDLFHVIPYYFHRAVNISVKNPLVTSDIRPLNTQTSYSPVDQKGFPINIVRDDKNKLLLQKKDKELVPLKEDLPEIHKVVHHSPIKIKDAQKNLLKIGESYQKTGYIVSSVQKVSGMKEFYLNSDAAAKSDQIAYITLEGRLEAINITNGLTIILPGSVPI